MSKKLLFLCFVGGYFFAFQQLAVTEAKFVGVNYGLNGDNLPSPKEVVSLMQSRGIVHTRLFEPNTNVLQALEDTNIDVIIGTLNQDLQGLATSSSFAVKWVQTNIVPYSSKVKFRFIAAGNEVIPGSLADYVLPAMKNLEAAVTQARLDIPVTTVVPSSVLGSSYPPSAGAFASSDIMGPIAQFLVAKNSSLLVNLYPYFAYSADPKSISLTYALGSGTAVVVQDGSCGYKNLLDAMLDSVYAALEKVGASTLNVIVTETGWPSAGDSGPATIANAKVYSNHLVAHVASMAGTPKRPGKRIETYIFALFNENQKAAGVEQNWGLYYPNKTEVYHVNLLSPNPLLADE